MEDVVGEIQDKRLSEEYDSAWEQTEKSVSCSVHPAINCIKGQHSVV